MDIQELQPKKRMLDLKELRPRAVEAARLMQMMSQPVRLQLLCILLGGEESVLALGRELELSQPAVSHHLKLLRDAGLVATRRDGQTIYYSLKGREVEAIINVLYQLYCAPK